MMGYTALAISTIQCPPAQTSSVMANKFVSMIKRVRLIAATRCSKACKDVAPVQAF
jgi:hypothetical protein